MKRIVPLLAALVVLAIPRYAASQGRNPFVDRSDTGETVHVLPSPASIHSPHDTAPTMAPPGNAADVHPASYGSGSLVNHHGPVISDAGFWALYWNSNAADARTEWKQQPDAQCANQRIHLELRRQHGVLQPGIHR